MFVFALLVDRQHAYIVGDGLGTRMARHDTQ